MSEMNYLESQYWDIKNSTANEEADINLIAILGLKPIWITNEWAFMWGDKGNNIIGLGATIALAAKDFNKAYYHQKEPYIKD